MDPIRQPSGRIDQSDSDADLNKLLYKTGQAVKRALVAVFRGIGKFFNGILLLLLFLMRNVIWIGVGIALGLGYGIYLLNTRGAKYQSEMVVRANFQSSRSLYNTIDYLNAMLSAGRRDSISAIFDLSAEEALSVEAFSIEPVESDVITARMYKNMFIEKSHNPVVNTADTVWLRTMSYDDYKTSLTKYDYPFYNINVVATNPGIFAKFQDGIVRKVSQIPFLSEARNSYVDMNREEVRVIENALNGIDTLRHVYNQRLLKTPAAPENDQLTILQNAPIVQAPELDLYDKLLELQDELRESKSRFITEQNVIEIFSPFNAVGRRVPFLQQSIGKYSLLGLVLSVVILLSIALYKELLKLEKRRRIA